MHSNSVSYDIPKIIDNQNIFNKAQTIPDNQYKTINDCKNISNSNISQETTEAKKKSINKYDYAKSYTFSSPNNFISLSDNYDMKFNGRNNKSGLKNINLSQTLGNLNEYYLSSYKRSEKELNELKNKYYSVERENKENKESLEELKKERDELTEKIDALNTQVDKLLNIIKDINLKKSILESEYLNFKENITKQLKKDYEEMIDDTKKENMEKINILNLRNQELKKENEALKFELNNDKKDSQIETYKKEIDDNQNEYKSDLENKNKIIDKLKEEIKNLNIKIKEQNEDFQSKEKELKKEIDQLKEINGVNCNNLN